MAWIETQDAKERHLSPEPQGVFGYGDVEDIVAVLD
jgi:hypothetical protein